MRDVACAYHCRAYTDRERDFWELASNAADEEDAWLRIEDFIYHVLVPYVAVELISEEMSISLEDALDVYNRSKTFGRDFNSDLNSEDFPNILKLVFKFYDLPSEDSDDEVRWFIKRFIRSSMLRMLQQPPSPAPKLPEDEASHPELSQDALAVERPTIKLTVRLALSLMNDLATNFVFRFILHEGLTLM